MHTHRLKSDKYEYSYSIKLKNPEKYITCNKEALKHSSINDNITHVKSGSSFKELQKMLITLSDVDKESQPVQVHLGTNLIGKFMMDQHKILTC